LPANGKQGSRKSAAYAKTETKKRWKEPCLPTETINSLALGIFRHEIFTSSHVEKRDMHLLSSIFSSLHSLPEQKQRELTAHPPSLIYAYTKDALKGRTINGYSVFGSSWLLWQRDHELLVERYERIRTAVDAAMGEQVKPAENPPSRSASKLSPVSPSQRLLSVKDFAALLGLSVWTVRGWAYKGRVASVKLGVRMMIPTTELDRLTTENLRPALSNCAAM